MITLKTKRLILRPVTADDAADVFSYLSKPEVVRHMGLEPFTTVEEALEEIAWYDAIVRDGTGMRWGITLTGQDEVIGSCGFLNVSSKHHRTEIGFELSSAYWGQGIAGEALEAVIRHGFVELGFHRIEALIEPENKASQRLVERHLFTREGLLRGYEYTRGNYDDLYMYSLLEHEMCT
ncbi:GNAT family N-acetyltransferase [Exiguobacterium sp. SH0S7]|uniref:GNAT family N-acetyltransferase n=1 Tax=Exiguobacterium sp. SH0S7 TaxID=2510951 RepID=UPI001F18867D|nr:GNAT family protein [Exiguobacterium sp. SH0S7]